MLTRRRFVSYSALSSAALAVPPLLRSALGQSGAASPGRPLRIAVLGNTYHLGSHLQDIADRFLVGYPFEGDWHMPGVQVVSLYVDQRARKADAARPDYEHFILGANAPKDNPPLQRSTGSPAEQAAEEKAAKASANSQTALAARRARARQQSAQLALPGDLSDARAGQFGFRLCNNIPEALRVGGNHLAVDAVLTVLEQSEHLPYPVNGKGQVLLPNFDFFQQCAQVFEEEGHSVPYFNYRQLSFSHAEAESMVKTAERLKFSLLAGSSMPVTWRLPDVDIPLGAHVEEAVMVGPAVDAMEFDALEAMQSMLERRKGGETGVKAVQLLEGDDVWAARKAGRWSNDLLSSALSRTDTPLGLTVLDGRTQDLSAPGVLPQLVKEPVAVCVEYIDGTRATLLLLPGAIRDFNISARVTGHGLVSIQLFMTPTPFCSSSACLASKIAQLYQTRTSPSPMERALLVSGMLEAALDSRHRLNRRVETPHLSMHYQAPKESQFART